jgi:hypothetical protein
VCYVSYNSDHPRPAQDEQGNKELSRCDPGDFSAKTKSLPIGIELSKKDFSKLFSQKSAPHLGEKMREIKEKLEKEDQRAKNIINSLNKFSFDAFAGNSPPSGQATARRQSSLVHPAGALCDSASMDVALYPGHATKVDVVFGCRAVGKSNRYFEARLFEFFYFTS